MSRSQIDTALQELRDDAVLPHPVRLRDLILRTKLAPQEAMELNREFQNYLSQFGEIQKLAGNILQKLADSEQK